MAVFCNWFSFHFVPAVRIYQKEVLKIPPQNTSCNWFSFHFVPAVRIYQEEVLKIPPQNARAILIPDNAPAHPRKEKLVRTAGKLRVFYLPPNMISILQPMDQGVTSALKRCYVSPSLNEILVVLEDTYFDVDTRGEQTLANMKNYNFCSAVHNFAAS